MAGETYYFFFSIILVFGAVFHISQAVYFRNKGTTFLGKKYHMGTPEYNKLNKLYGASGIAFAVLATLFLLANLAYSIDRVIRLHTTDSRFLLIFAPISMILVFLALFFYMRKNPGIIYPPSKRHKDE